MHIYVRAPVHVLVRVYGRDGEGETGSLDRKRLLAAATGSLPVTSGLTRKWSWVVDRRGPVGGGEGRSI